MIRAKLKCCMSGLSFTHWGRLDVQIAGGHKYLPPRQDVNAPDLYIPLMAAATYCLLVCASTALIGKFKTEVMYTTVGPPA